MTLSLSPQAQTDMLDKLFRGAGGWPTSAYVALFDATGNEIPGTNYARVLVNFDTATWSDPVSQQTATLVDVVFAPGPPNPSDWGTIGGYAFMYGAAAGANDYLSDIIPLGTPKTPGGGAALVFPAGTLTATAQGA